MGVVVQLLNTLLMLVEALLPESEKFIPAIFSATYTLVGHTAPAVQKAALDLIVVSCVCLVCV